MTKDTVKIHGKDYETVASRVQRFLNKEDASIVTEIVELNEIFVVMKASIVDANNRVLGTGHAEEYRQASPINKTSALENCETSAIGRALAAVGYAGTEYASADEVANAVSQQNDYTPAKQLKGEATEKQVGMIEAKTNGMKVGNPAAHKEFGEWYKKELDNKPFKNLTKAEASKVIDKLMNKQDEQSALEEYSDEVF